MIRLANIRFVLVVYIFFHMMLLSIISCGRIASGEEKQEIEFQGKPVEVSINLGGIVWGNGDSDVSGDFTDSHVLIKGENRDPLVIDTKPQVLAIGDNNSIISYIYLKYEDGGNVYGMQNGDKFRVIAYKKLDGTYYVHKDYVVGQPYESIRLNVGEDYEIVSYTFGSDYLPELSSLERGNIRRASIQLERESVSLVAFQRQEFTPVGGELSKNVIGVKMESKTSFLGVVFRSLGSDIPIENAGFTMSSNTYFSKAKMDLKTGKFSCVSGCDKEEKIATTIGGGIIKSYKRQFFIFGDRKSISIDAKVKIFDSEEYFSDMFFYLPQGKKITVYIDFRVCGAYMDSGKTNFRRFMCNDLGGEVINPNQTVVRREQHGDYYIWGLKDPVILRQFFQGQNRSKWSFNWSDTDKEKFWYIEMPDRKFDGACPKGWRIPNHEEWESVNKNSSSEYLGSDVPYTIGVRVGENMLLPISGFVGYYGNSFIPKSGDGAYRWTYNGDVIDDKKMVKHAWAVAFLEKYKDNRMVSAPKFSGVSLRCIKNQ